MYRNANHLVNKCNIIKFYERNHLIFHSYVFSQEQDSSCIFDHQKNQIFLKVSLLLLLKLSVPPMRDTMGQLYM